MRIRDKYSSLLKRCDAMFVMPWLTCRTRESFSNSFHFTRHHSVVLARTHARIKLDNGKNKTNGAQRYETHTDQVTQVGGIKFMR